jgi:hypothetical protein
MIISFSGKKRSGKDTAGKIAQIILSFNKISNEDIIKYLEGGSLDNPEWKIKKWATYLKQIVADLSGCTPDDLENENVKNQIIYTKYRYKNDFLGDSIEYEKPDAGLNIYKHMTETFLRDNSIDDVSKMITYEEIGITRRMMLERIGTEVGRYIHSNIWIDQLMSQYKPKKLLNTNSSNKENFVYKKPNWIITDTRFINEAEKVKSVKGINIRINRTLYNYDDSNVTFKELRDLIFKDTGEYILKDYADSNYKVIGGHKSETELDNYTGFDYYIDNDKSLDMLIYTIRKILTKEKLIND